MVQYAVPKPPLSFFGRVREGVRLANAFIKGDKTTISDITSDTVFSPLQPLQPFYPQAAGRAWDYQSGYNVQTRPDGYGRISFAELRGIARQCEIVRLVLRSVKDQVCAFEWQIVPKEDSTVDPDDPRIKELTKFFERPDRVNTWDQWLRLVLDDHLVIDALSIYRVKDKVGRPYAFEVFDGARIKSLIDADGRRPLPPDPAFQQVMRGSPWIDYTTDELLYMPRNMTPDYPVRGVSAVEDAVMTARTIIERQKSQLLFFTDGTMPDSYAKMPENMTTEAIKAFEENFNNILRGNLAGRRGTPFLPSGAEIVPLKQADLKGDVDEWFARIVCFTFGVAPTAFIRQMNRSSSESDKERAEQEGQLPKMKYIKLVLDQLIGDFGPDYSENFEFSWRESANMDAKEQAGVITEYVKTGVKTINEGRSDLGLDPIEGGDSLMALTPTGYVPLDSFEQNQQMQQQNMQVQAEARASALANAGNQDGGKEPTDGKQQQPKSKSPKGGKKQADKGFHIDASDAPGAALGKAVRHKPIPFRRPIVEHAQQELVIKIHHILQKTAVSVARQLAKKHLKLAKDDNNDAAEDVADAAIIAGALDLSSLEALTDATPAYLERIAADSGKQVLSMLGVFNNGDLVNQVNQNALAFARERSAEMIGKKWVNGKLVDNPDADWVITDATRDDIQSIIASVYLGDLSPSDLEGAIKTAGAFSEERATIIARTEVINANSQGTLVGMRSAREAGVKVMKEWLPDDEACPICEENGNDEDIDVDAEFSSGDDAPPAHPNAVLSGSMFLSYGAVKRMISAEYDGLAISLRAGAYRTTIGPNHPMLTDTGLRPAKLLKKGDKLVCDSRTVETAFFCKSDLKKVELVENSFGALKAAFGYSRVAAARDDFHGDVVFCADEIDIVFPKRALLDKLDSLGVERMRKGGLDRPDVQLLTIPCPSPGEQDIRVIFLTSASGVRCDDVGHFVLIEIEEIELVDFKGFAYDCTTETGIYCSDGFVVSNCECSIIPVTESDDDQSNDEE